MCSVLLELIASPQDDRPVPRIDRSRTELEHPMQRAEVTHQIAVRRIDEARAPADDRVSREQGARPLLEERDVIRRVPRRVRSDQLDVAGADPLAVAESL